MEKLIYQMATLKVLTIGKNDSLFLGVALSTDNGRVLGKIECTTVGSWYWYANGKLLGIADVIILVKDDGTKEGFSDSLQQGYPG